MEFEYICYDYVDIPTKCNFCPRTLTSGKGIYCKDLVNNKFFFSGPLCATKNSSKFKNSRKNIPDYTTECFLSENDEEIIEVTSSTKATKKGISGQNNCISSSNDSSDILKKAKEYIIFCYSRLADFKGVTYYTVDNIYRDLKTNEALSAKSEEHLINWYKSKNTKYKNSKYRFENLKNCYCVFHLCNNFKKRLNDDSKKNYFDEQIKELKEKLFLSKIEVQKINNWFTRDEFFKKFALEEDIFSNKIAASKDN